MDKPIPFWIVLFTVIILVIGSYCIYLWLESLKNITKDSDDNT